MNEERFDDQTGFYADDKKISEIKENHKAYPFCPIHKVFFNLPSYLKNIDPGSEAKYKAMNPDEEEP